ncbi:YdcF family protein [Aurantimonas sp. A2-1-M11]|uniref:YdcF family protein n=1 Tax=Aurantimonas sp. A2-1-M11 TaxID=3113712 RepID=UPI002F94DAFD
MILSSSAHSHIAGPGRSAPRRPPANRPAWPVLRRLWLAAIVAAVLLGGYLAGGFLRFAEEVSILARPVPIAPADGIVVLTGGALRIDQAIDLLKDGHGRRLLISGVNPHTSAETLARMTDTDRALFACCVDLDYAALNTVGNAEIARNWAREHGFRDLILVTSDYHMPRSLREFDRVGELRSVTPYAVRRDDLWTADSMPNSAGLRVLLTEYAKLIAARVRLVLGVAQSDSVATELAGLDP